MIRFLRRLKSVMNQTSASRSAKLKIDSQVPQPDRLPTAFVQEKLLSGKTVLITGAGRNIGHSIALEMAQQGANIVFTDIDPTACDRLQQELEPYGVTGIRVNGIAPGWVAEDDTGQTFHQPYMLLRRSSINAHYVGRAAVYLASDYFSRFTTGTILKIDAGVSLYNYRTAQHPPCSNPKYFSSS